MYGLKEFSSSENLLMLFWHLPYLGRTVSWQFPGPPQCQFQHNDMPQSNQRHCSGISKEEEEEEIITSFQPQQAD
jgi:hypothetical protein